MKKLAYFVAFFVFTPFIFMQPQGAHGSAPAMGTLFGGPFELVNQDLQVVTQDSFKGSFMLINFGYTFCPDICPTSLATMASALDELGPIGDVVQPIFITVDPKRDTPENLKPYVEAFHPRLIGLSGSNQKITQIAKAYRVHRSKIIEAGKPADEYLVNHSSLTYLMDQEGKFLTIFPHGTKPEIMAKAIKKYIK